MTDLNQLYKTAVLEHNRNPVNYGKPDTMSHQAQGLNAICGDMINVYLLIEDEQIQQIYFDGECCAIAMASASMMCAFLSGKTVSEARQYFERFNTLMDKTNTQTEDPILGGLNVLSSVKKFPSRIKSATLCWHAMLAAMDGQDFATTEK
ncbi:Fe-S cluster assembly sulfur transfer protein SufU [Marinicella sp. W31]|uniref:Fe-S cluster assembly sulfur transfer protein SufU n=1 Tax=Marinicella sp. W31 TaxID=3023713 RepID=UPI0037572684